MLYISITLVCANVSVISCLQICHCYACCVNAVLMCHYVFFFTKLASGEFVIEVLRLADKTLLSLVSLFSGTYY